MRRRGLRTRLVVSFVAVALVGVATLAVLVLILLPGRLSSLVVERQDAAARRAAGVLENAYRRHGGLRDLDVRRAATIAAIEGGGIEVTTGSGADAPNDTPPTEPTPGPDDGGTGAEDEAGEEPGTPEPSPSEPGRREGPGSDDGGNGQQGNQGDGDGQGQGSGPTGAGNPSEGPGTGGEPSPSGPVVPGEGGGNGPMAAGPEDGRTVEIPIVVDGRTVGTLTVDYPAGGLPRPEADFAASLRWSIAVASALAILVALAVALVVGTRLGRPLSRLTGAARRLGTGDLSVRVGSVDAPGEVGELAATFDQMADALAREDEVRRALVADVAHELRTPVTILQASLEELVDGTVEPATDRLSSLHDEVLRLARILQDLETLAAAQAAGLEMSVVPVDLAGVAGGALDRLRPAFDTADVEPHLESEPVTVLGDPTRLDQVVTNLLTNAMKFTPAGGEVWVRVAGDDGNARIEVVDSGPGIPPDDIPHVFERFWRGTTGRETSGSGVGLAVVAELVRAHRGRVDVSSSTGEGARFQVTLPRV